jgi:hypothetical protein
MENATLNSEAEARSGDRAWLSYKAAHARKKHRATITIKHRAHAPAHFGGSMIRIPSGTHYYRRNADPDSEIPERRAAIWLHRSVY